MKNNKNNKKRKNKKVKISAKTTIMILVLGCLLCLVGAILLACNNSNKTKSSEQPAETISSEQAVEIMLNDLGITAEQMGNPHVHEGTYDNQACYNIYVTVNGESLMYIISTTGEILYHGEGSHSH